MIGGKKTWTQKAVSTSVVLHVVFVIAAGFIVALKSLHKPQAQFQSENPVRPRMEPRKLELKVKVTDLQKRSARPKLQPRLLAMAPSPIALPEIKTPPKPVDRKVKRNFATVGVSGFGSGIGGGLGTGFGGGMGGGLPTMLSGRCSKTDRLARLRASGGKKESEEAVVKGLRYLKATQNGDGSWGGKYKGAMTGLALLAFLGHCETHRSREFGPQVKGAIDFLVATGKKRDGWMHFCGDKYGAYAQGITTYALAEAYTLTKLKHITPVLKDAVNLITSGQSKDGGWDYPYNAYCTRSDTSVSGWQIQALKAASLTGIPMTGLKSSIKHGVDYLKMSQKGDGNFGYRANTGGGWNLTGLGVFGIQMGGKGSSSNVRKGIDALLDRKLNYNAGNPSLYGWYYGTMAAFQKGGSSWKKWNAMFQDQLLVNQADDGSWNPEAGDWSGKKVPGDIFRTCLCILMLEVYYRYLPASG